MCMLTTGQAARQMPGGMQGGRAMQSRITGTTMPVLEFLLDHDDTIVSEAGELSWMSASIQMMTHTQMGGGGGFFGALKRVAGGGTLFMTEYRAVGVPGEIAFATKVPGHIVPVEVANGREYFIHRHGFLCATAGVQLGVGFQQSLGAGIFGGDGFLLQRVGGVGMAWLELSGELIVKDLKPGELLRVHPGHVGAFEADVNFQIMRIPGHPQHDLWRGWHLPGRAHRTGPCVAADAAHLEAGAQAAGVYADRAPGSSARWRCGRTWWARFWMA